MKKVGIVAVIFGLMLVALFSMSVSAKGIDVTEEKTCGLVGVKDVHLGLNEYSMEKGMEKTGKFQDPRPWFRNIWRSARGVASFSHSTTWDKCIAYAE